MSRGALDRPKVRLNWFPWVLAGAILVAVTPFVVGICLTAGAR